MSVDGRRRTPDRRSPVQPAKTGLLPVATVAVVALAAAWTLSDTWSGTSDLPSSSSQRTDRTSTEPQAQTGAQSPNGSLAGLFSPDDYPADAQMRDEQGTVEVSLSVDRRGRVSRCDVVESSGSLSLDSATCRILRRRARFTPAQDNLGRPATDSVTQRITWRLEG